MTLAGGVGGKGLFSTLKMNEHEKKKTAGQRKGPFLSGAKGIDRGDTKMVKVEVAKFGGKNFP